MAIRNTILILLCLLAIDSQAQNFDLKINIIDKANSNAIEFANVIITPCSCGGASDENGNLEIELPPANYQLVTTYVGYNNDTTNVVLNKNQSIDIYLEANGFQLNDITITGEDSRDNIEQTVMGVQQLTMTKMKMLPAAFGEVDVLSSLSLLAGVGSAGEASNGLSVRGGSLDQNLVLLDNAPIFNPTHLFGLFSVFTPEAVGSVELFRSNMPSKYGGRISSVVDVKVKNPSEDKFTLTGGLGLSSTRLAMETPIIKKKLYVLASTRMFYNDFMFSFQERLKNTKANFIDGTVKFKYIANEKNTLSFTAFASHDFYQLDVRSQITSITSSSNQYDYSTINGSLNWLHTLSKDAFLRTTLVSSNYAPKILFPVENSDNVVSFESRIQTQSIQSEYSKTLNTNWNYSGGLELNRTMVSPGSLLPGTAEGLEEVKLATESSYELSAYANTDWTPSEKLSISVGLRFTQFLLVGPYDKAIYESEALENISSIESFGTGEIVQDYNGLEPRFGLRYKFSESNSIKASYALTRQYLQNIYNSTTPLPTSRWKTSDTYIKPQLGHTYSLGYYKNIESKELTFSAEVYYRTIDNVLDYKPGADFFLQQYIETDILQGMATNYGLELSLEKRKGNGTVYGWANYTLSKSQRKFDASEITDRINNNQWFNSDFDRPHVFNGTLNIDMNTHNTFSFNFTYQTGKPYSIPNASFTVNNILVPIYLERNNARLPDYHRLDFSWRIHNITTKTEKRFKGDWIFTVYNLYGRTNAFNRFFGGQANGYFINQISIFNSTLFSLSYNFKFK